MRSMTHTRRGFLALTAGTMFGAQSPSILVHEHVLVNFARAKYDPDAVFAIVKPKLDAVVQLGCSRFQDCTPNFIGRDPKLLMRLTDACGIEIWTNTGLMLHAIMNICHRMRKRRPRSNFRDAG